MRKWTLLLMLLLTALSVAAADNNKNSEEIEKLKAKAPAEDANGQVKAFTKIAELQMKQLSTAYDQGNSAEAEAALQDVLDYGVKAAHTAQESHKRMKQTEISLRKICDRLSDIGRSLSFEERQPVTDAVNKLETARSDLLHAMFRKR